MLAAGFSEEAARIRAHPGFGPTSVQALGYATALRVHDGEIEREEAARAIALETRQFARRQRTWYRKFQDITWLGSPPPGTSPGPDLVDAALRALDPRGSGETAL
jgi:tRNA dimethylallyltransferase